MPLNTKSRGWEVRGLSYHLAANRCVSEIDGEAWIRVVDFMAEMGLFDEAEGLVVERIERRLDKEL